MKVNKIIALRLMLSMIIIVGFLVAVKKSSSSNASRGTGWDIDSKKSFQ
jgi:hypothetical protein